MELDYVIVALEYQPTGDSVDVVLAPTLTSPNTFTVNITQAQAKSHFVGKKLKLKIMEAAS